MEANGMSGRMLGLEMSLQQQQQQQKQHFSHPNHQHLASSYPIQETQSLKQSNFSYPTKAKQQQFSDEDEAGYNGDEGGDGKKKISIAQWQRMKWTDNMVRLLIMVVFYIGDDCSVEVNDTSSGGVKKKGSGVLQKKGKWKSVSRAMTEKGFYVSPQQCEDKFNDLNKRYKRVNDILGKGTACRVVENQGLLDTMDQLTPKMKEEAKKLLNSKHLFFKEMCAYHNSGGGCSNGGGYQSPDAAVELQKNCLHSAENGGAVGANLRNGMELGMKNSKGGSQEVVDLDDEDDDEDDDDDDDNEEEDETEGGSVGGRSHENNGDENEMVSSKRQRRQMFSSPQLKQMSCELVSMLQDGSRTPWEQRQWMMSRMMELEEQKVSYQCQAFELEKQRLKWIKFSAKKEREMERMKLNNEGMRLENERMVLLLRKKEIELLHPIQQHSSNR